MERITMRHPSGAIDTVDTGYDISDILERLAMYEDTDLTPQKIMSLKSKNCEGDQTTNNEDKYMDIKKSITINLSPDDVKRIISDYLTKDGYSVSPVDIEFDIGEECHGYGVGEHYEYVFEGCSVRCKEKGE